HFQTCLKASFCDSLYCEDHFMEHLTDPRLEQVENYEFLLNMILDGQSAPTRSPVSARSTNPIGTVRIPARSTNPIGAVRAPEKSAIIRTTNTKPSLDINNIINSSEDEEDDEDSDIYFE